MGDGPKPKRARLSGPRIVDALDADQQAYAARSSKLYASCLTRFGWGLMPAKQIQAIFADAVADLRQSDVPASWLTFARLGAAGRQSSHCQRDLMKQIVAPMIGDISAIIRFPLAMKTLKRKSMAETVTTDYSMIAPHKLAASLFEHRRTVFNHKFFGAPLPGNYELILQDFWQRRVHPEDPRKAFMLQEYLAKGWVANQEEFERKVVPLAIHGDGVAVTNRLTYDAVSFSSVLAEGLPTIDSKMLIGGCLNRCKVKNTRDQWWRVASWSLEALLSGKHPRLSHQGTAMQGYDASIGGKPLCDGLLFGVFMIRSDMEYATNYLGLEHFQSLTPCPWCTADSNSVPWTDVRCCATWRRHMWVDKTDAQWRASRGGPVHPLFKLTGVTISTFTPDSMHILDLGVWGRVVSNAAHHLLYDGILPGRNHDQRLESLWCAVKAEYMASRPPSQLSNLTSGMFGKQSEQPDTHIIKAAETRHLVPVLGAVWSRVADFTNPTQCRIRVLFDHAKEVLACMEELKDIDLFYTPPAIRLRLMRGIQGVATQYSALSAECIHSKTLRFKFVPKIHFMLHIAAYSKFQNPRKSWTYSDESFMGILKAILQSCARGTKANNMGVKANEKWLTGTLIRQRVALGEPVG